MAFEFKYKKLISRILPSFKGALSVLSIWLVLSSLLFFLARTLADKNESDRISAFKSKVNDLAKIAEFAIETQLENYDNSLLILRAAYITGIKNFQSTLELLRKGPLSDKELLIVFVNSGGILSFTDTPNAKTGLYLGDRSYFRNFASGDVDHLYIDEPSFGRVTKRYTLPLARPVFGKDGKFLGVLALSVKQQSLVNFDHRMEFSDKTTINVVNHNGSIVSKSLDFEKAKGSKIATELLNRLVSSESGVFTFRHTQNDKEKIIAYRHILAKNSPLIVFIQAYPERLYASIASVKKTFYISASIFSLLIFFLLILYVRSNQISKQLIQSLKKSKELEYQALTQTSLDGFFIANTQGKIIDVNNKFVEMLNYTRDELLSLYITDFELLESESEIKAHMDSVIKKGNDFYQSKFKKKDNSSIDVEVNVLYKKEIGDRLFVFVRDISLRKKAEQEIKHLNFNLEEKVKERTSELKELNEEMEAFSYSVSHDLRSPLNNIEGFSVAALEDYDSELTENTKNYISHVRVSIKKMLQLIEDLLKLTRITRVELNYTTVDLSEIVNSIANDLKKAEPSRKVLFNIANNVSANGDFGLLKVVLINLIANSWKFTRKKSEAKIEFGFYVEGNEKIYYVKDNGAGFNSKYKNKLFKSFQRLHAEKDFPGTGIGLSIVKRVITRHRGRVWAESEEGVGTTFFFTLPS